MGKRSLLSEQRSYIGEYNKNHSHKKGQFHFLVRELLVYSHQIRLLSFCCSIRREVFYVFLQSCRTVQNWSKYR